MKKLLILSGKGGTGKTTTTAAFIDFSRAKTFADCDVDAPNLHLMAAPDTKPFKKPYLGSQKAFIAKDKCTGCNTCKNNCRFNAIYTDEFSKCAVDIFACEGCGVCTIVCPYDAITMQDDIAGEHTLYLGDVTFSTAKLKMGRGNSGKLVTEVKSAMIANARDSELAIIDGSPGIGCPVIASISGVDFVLIVTEPSLSGISDLKRILKTCSIFNTSAAVCVNKYDTCPENTYDIKNYCVQNNIPFVGMIPYDPQVTISINENKSIASVDCPARKALYKIYKSVTNLIFK